MSTNQMHSTTGPGMQYQSGKEAEPGPVIDALSSAQEGEFREENRLPKDDLPSFGEKIPDFCGEDLPHFCEDCAKTVIFGRTCQRSMCPRCWASWVLRTCTGRGRDSPGVVPALEALRKQQWSRTPEDVVPKFHHTIFSPPRYITFEAENPREKAFEIIKAALQAMNIPGAYVVYHPYRGKDEIADAKEAGGGDGFDAEQEAIRDLVDEDWSEEDEEQWLNDDRGEWKDRLGEDREWEGDVEDEVVFSPHFHVICVSDWVRGEGLTEYVHEETGWVIHRITGGDSSVSIPDLDALARVTTYCLSHAGIYENSNGDMQVAARRVGDLHGMDVFEKTEEDADLAVRKAAPTTLDIHAPTLACDAEVPVEQGDEADGHDCEDDECPEPTTGKDDVTATAQAALIRESEGASPIRLSDTYDGVLPTSDGLTLPSSTADMLAGSGAFDLAAAVDEATEIEVDGDETTPMEDVLGTVEDVEDQEAEPETEPCNGAFLNLGAAPAKLEDDEWRERAPFVTELILKLEEWKEKEEWIGG